ncbi:MAG: ATP-grasp domain-containing protein [Deltaproteobacteria bacterium]|jgi:biotin carboxylase|nr:ATP-grasp domain-containing protein [Deltaproteobacteria bacterium]
MAKKLLILGASLNQIPAILKAQSLGHLVVTTDNLPQNPGHALANISYHLDTTDIPAVLAIAKKEKISGVLAPATDVAVVTAATVAAELRLPGPNVLAAKILTSKADFRAFAQTHDVPCPDFWTFDQPIFPPNAPKDGRLLIVKPNRSSGAKGVMVVDGPKTFAEAAPLALSYSLDGRGVLETYLLGGQYTVEGVLANGRISLSMITIRSTAPRPYEATWAHRVPCDLNQKTQETVLATLERIFDLLGYKDGPFDADFLNHKQDTFILEATPRIGGNSLSTLFAKAFDFDIVGYAVSAALGEPFVIPPPLTPKPLALVLLGVLTAGSVVWDQNEEAALRREKWLKDLSWDVSIGDPVKPFINGRERLGEALIAGDGPSNLVQNVLNFGRRLNLRAELVN